MNKSTRLAAIVVSFSILLLRVVGSTLSAQIVILTASADPEKLCGFANRSIELYVVGANTPCVWNTSGVAGASVSPRGQNGDTVTLLFPQNPKTGTLSVSAAGINHSIRLTQVPKANEATGLSVRKPICENVIARFSVNKDGTDYTPGELCLRWANLDEKGDELYFTSLCGNSANEYSYSFPLDYENGTVKVGPYTCDESNRKTGETSILLTPFVRKGLETETNNLKLSKLEYDNISNPTEPAWVESKDLKNIVCAYYSPLFNANNPTKGEYENFYGVGDGYVYLQAGEYIRNLDYSQDPEFYYTYEWDFNSEDFEMADIEMGQTPLVGHGFGSKKNRVALKVLKKDHPNKDHPVKVTITCQTCIDKGGSPADFTRVIEMNLVRQDSIKTFTDYTVEGESTEICAGKENTFLLKILDEEEYKDKNIGEFFWTFPSSWTEIKKIEGGYTCKTGRSSGMESPGDTVKITVYPRNSCFSNKRKETENGKKISIFVKNQPAKPHVFDPITGMDILPENTDYYLSQHIGTRKDTVPFLLCNYNSWIKEQDLGIRIKNDTIHGFFYCDFDNLLKPLQDLVTITSLKKDSASVSITLKEDYRVDKEGVLSKKIGFYGVNSCGEGDTGVFYINIIDTLNVYSPIALTTSIDEALVFDTLCEGAEINLTSRHEAYLPPTVPTKFSITDRIQFDWDIPGDWIIGNKESHPPLANIHIGQSSGNIKLKFTNKCGSSSAVKTKDIFARDFIRVNIASDTNPCQGSVVQYSFDSVFEADKYQWTFPNDWKIEGLGTNTAVSKNSEANEKGKLVLDVKVGVESGYIYVVGAKNTSSSCDFRFENYATKHRRDSLAVGVKRYTEKPIKDGTWPDTICARDRIAYMLKPPKGDTNVSFSWEFPSSDWEEKINYSNKKDTVDMGVPELSHVQEEIRIVSQYNLCAATNIGDTLSYKVWVMDTLSPVGPFYDARFPDSKLNHNPCEGDTVEYILDRSSQDVNMYYSAFSWNGGRTFVSGDSITVDGWRVLSPVPYHDTLKMIVGRSSLNLAAAIVSSCDTSSYYSDVIEPVSLVVDTGFFTEDKAFLCNKEDLVFEFEPVKNATHYVFCYPWGKKKDTIVAVEGTDIYKRSFASVAYNTGSIYFTPYNVCGLGPNSKEIKIKDVLYPPKEPVLYDFKGEYNLAVSDTALDTICHREVVRLKAFYKDDENPEYKWTYKWELTQEDVSVTLETQAVPNDSLCDFTKQNGESFVNFVSVSAKHESCKTFGDKQIIELRSMDTASIPADKNIRDYLFDLETGTKIETGPCGADTVAYYFKNSELDKTISNYYFTWNGGQNYNITDSTMDGTSFKLLEIAENKAAWDTLKMSVGSAERLNIQIVTSNYCGNSSLPSIAIETKEAIMPSEVYELHKVSTSLCNNETIVFKIDSLAKATAYVWHFPWKPFVDTTYTATRAFKTNIGIGKIFVHPYNGCGLGHATDTLEIKAADILSPPSKLVPVDFAFGYKPGVDLKATDSICVRTDSKFSVACLEKSEPEIVYKWSLVDGKADGFVPQIGTDSIVLIKQGSLSDKAYKLYAAARLQACKTFGDTLLVELFAMDTVSFATTVVADTTLAKFTVNPLNLISNTFPLTPEFPIPLNPCGLTTVRYEIEPDIHWSLDTTAWFSWNGGQTALSSADSSFDNLDWKSLDPDLLPGVIYAKMGNKDSLPIALNIRNRCGFSVSSPIEIKPSPSITEKPQLISVSSTVCFGGDVNIRAKEVPFAQQYIWKASWKNGTDTTNLPKIDYPNYRMEEGVVRVWARNDCGNGLISDSIKISTPLKTPDMPLPTWANNLVVIGDTVRDTICLHGGTILLKAVSPTAGNNTVYDWKIGYGNIDIMPDDYANDSLLTVFPAEVAVKGNEALLYVSARRQACSSFSDTLYIKLNFTDTVPMSDLGALIMNSTFNPQPCPGSVISLTVEHGLAAPAYHWTLPHDWVFAEGVDSMSSEVSVIVGSAIGRIEVAAMTDRDGRYCTYYAIENALFTQSMNPHQPLQTSDFTADFKEAPCVGSEQTYSVSATAGARGYRWELPFGWKVIKPEADAEADSVWLFGKESCKVIVGSNQGKIKVYALDSCDTYQVKGFVKERTVTPVDTARLEIVADLDVCIDSTLVIEIKHNKWSIGRYKLDINYIGPDQTLNTFAFPSAPDSSLINVKCSNKDSVILTFTPFNAVCANNIAPSVYIITADSVPSIPGAITGPDWVCMGAKVVFNAKADIDDGSNNVGYTWVVPTGGGWNIEKGKDSSTVLVTIGVYVENGSAYKDTIKCYPKALCGTADPYIWVITIDPAADFNDRIVVDNDNPCVGTDVSFRLEKKYDLDSISFEWTAPDSWALLGGSEDTLQTYTVSLSDKMDIEVRFLNNKSCGLSKPITYSLSIKDSASKAKLTTLPYPCKASQAVSFVVRPDANIDSVDWTFTSSPSQGFVTELYSRIGFNIKNDSVVLRNPNVESVFYAGIRSFNDCGHRDTLIEVVPVDRIPGFTTSTLLTNHYCPGDTAFAYISVPSGHKNTGTSYFWTVSDPFKILVDTVADNGNTAVVTFESTNTLDTAEISLYAMNDCNITDTIVIKTTPYSYWIKAKTAKDTAVYNETGIALQIAELQYKTVDDYDFTWTPGNRVSVSGFGTADVAYQTTEVVRPIEEYYVVASEKIAAVGGEPFFLKSSSCLSYDTAYLVVDSTFAMSVKSPDTACLNVEFEFSANPYGGNAQKYFFDWYRAGSNGEYEALGVTEERIVIMADEPEVRVMVVGHDSTYVYPTGATNVEPLYSFSKVDTQYMVLHTFDVDARWVQPGKEELKVPYGTKVTLSAKASGGGDTYYYNWEPKEIMEPYENTSSLVRTLRLFKDCTPTLTIKDSLTGCTKTLEMNIVMDDVIGEIPNAFSPNGDGVNDVFMRGVDLVIFDRSGVELFRSTAQEGWDGVFKGKVVKKGEYMYVVSIVKEGQTYMKKGVVTVF